MRSILLVGGAPRISLDAVRFISVAASGVTAVQLKENLQRRGLAAELLLGLDASPSVVAQRYVDREQLEIALKKWIALNPTGVVVMSAAVNDYSVAHVTIDPRRHADALVSGSKTAIARWRCQHSFGAREQTDRSIASVGTDRSDRWLQIRRSRDGRCRCGIVAPASRRRAGRGQ